jgi:hypothetical protein
VVIYTARKKRKKMHPVEIKHDDFIKQLLLPAHALDKMLEEKGITSTEFQEIMDEYHLSLDKWLEHDKKIRQELLDDFEQLGIALKDDLKRLLTLDLPEPSGKSYCKVFNGEKWIEGKPERMGSKSIVSVEFKEHSLEE